MTTGQSPSGRELDPAAPREPAGRGSADAGTEPASGSGRRWWAYVVVAVVVAVAVVAAGYAFMEMTHKSSPSSGGSVLVQAGTLLSLPPDQYDAVIFAQNSPATVVGTITNVGGAQLYIMNPAEYLNLVNTYNVTGYEWTSGPIQSDTYYQVHVTIPSGSWDLVFSNSVPGNSTAIGFYSNLVENP